MQTVFSKLRLPCRHMLADQSWTRFLNALPEHLKEAAPELVSGVGEEGCKSWPQLKFWTYLLSAYEQHGLYEDLLESYDTVVPVSASEYALNASFIGSGHGSSTLNTYRSIRFSECPGSQQRWLFEKVYNHEDYDDLARISVLEQKFGPRLRAAGVGVPQLLDVRRGKKITIVYTAFAPARRLPKPKAIEQGAQVVKVLMQQEIADIAGVLNQYHYGYLSVFSRARDWISSKYPASLPVFDGLGSLITSQYPRYLAHGDLHHKNLLTSGAVLDWDSCGFYPVGFDPGLILARAFRGKTVEELEGVVKDSFLPLADDAGTPYLHLGTLFHAFVFAAGKKSVMSDALLSSLLTRLLEIAEADGL